jgi:NhaP-type Na+/H+ or K+/H+ antiporter
MNLIRLVVYSPVIVSLLLIFVFIFLRQRYRWALGDFFQYIFLGGVIGFIVAIVYVWHLTSLYNSPQGPLALFWYGPLAISIGELEGFVLYIWQVARKRKSI